MKTRRLHAIGPVANICIPAALMLAGTMLESTPAFPQTFDHQQPVAPRTNSAQPAQKNNLTIASWNLEDAVSSGAIIRHKPKRKIWRNTFVPRQKAYRGQTELDEALHSADIVLLQGVNSIREARKLFPARRWKLIISRAILKVARGRGPFPRIMPEGFVTTAIAVRYQLGIRVTGQEHLLEIANAETKVKGTERQPSPDPKPVLAPAPPSTVGQKQAAHETPASEKLRPPETTPETNIAPQAGLAVRVYSKGKMIWFVSVALGTPCKQGAKCPSREVLRSWVEDKGDYDIPVVTAGRLFEKPAESPKQAPHSANETTQKQESEISSGEADTGCANQDIKLDKQLKGTLKRVARAGCIALAVIHQ